MAPRSERRAIGLASCYASLAHSLQSGLPPVPVRKFSLSILFPVLHSVLLWWTACRIECHGFRFAMSTIPPILTRASTNTLVKLNCFWYSRRDSNPHGQLPSAFGVRCVCQFRHSSRFTTFCFYTKSHRELTKKDLPDKALPLLSGCLSKQILINSLRLLIFAIPLSA